MLVFDYDKQMGGEGHERVVGDEGYSEKFLWQSSSSCS